METAKLTEKQEALLDLLLSGRRWRDALDEVGYSSGTSKSDILKSSTFREELTKRIEGMIAMNGVESVQALEEAMTQPHLPGAAIKVKAATEFLDRMGLGKVTRTEHQGDPVSGVFILPAKKETQ